MIPPNEPILTRPSDAPFSDEQDAALHPAADHFPASENSTPPSVPLDESFQIEGSVDPDHLELPPEVPEPEPEVTASQPNATALSSETLAVEEDVACKVPSIQATPIESSEFQLLQSKRPDPCMILERLLHSFRIPTSLPAEPLSDEAFPFD
ncbi:MAG: hypothetical protein QF752_16805 [Planctomycetota bacterium]|jgi:hypothetical protein|nr:hypothetical protein [Planctomycetota bacterium]